MDVERFAHEFLQGVLAESDADGQFVEDVFFQRSCEQLMEAGELDAADRVPFRSPSRGIRVDGYGGDPAEAVGTLNLIVLDFHPAPEVGRLTGTGNGRGLPALGQLSAPSTGRAVARCSGRNQSSIRAS